MLHFGHRHVFRTHHHRNATGESAGRNLVYTACPLADPRSGQTISYSIREPSAIRLVAEHFANGLLALTTGTGISSGPRELDRQMSVVLSAPHRSRCGNSSRAVNSYEPLGGENGLACKGRGCAIIGKRTVAKSAREKVLRLFIGICSALGIACIDIAP